MRSITDPAPEKIRVELHHLRARLDDTIRPKRVDENLLIATWNLRAFGAAAIVTPKTQPRNPATNERPHPRCTPRIRLLNHPTMMMKGMP
jgi:hypothetical protein